MECEEYKIWNSLPRNFLYPPVNSPLLDQNIFLNTLFSNKLNGKYKCLRKRILIWKSRHDGCYAMTMLFSSSTISALQKTLVARHFRNQRLIFAEWGSCPVSKNPLLDSSDGAWNPAGTFSLAVRTSGHVLNRTSLLCRRTDNTGAKSEPSFSSPSLLSVHVLFHPASFWM